ncbi:MAG: CHAT domain-containing protein, partial [Microcystaceae cyanobacterium]
ERIKGDKADNLELAIQCHQNALQIRTKSQFPQDWAMTQNNLGVAYMERIKGDKEDSLELAIQYHQNALQIHTKTDFPQDWAITQNNLGVAYIKRIKGDKEDNLELAIQYHQNALQIYAKSKFPQDWAMIQHNLGNTYIKRIKGDKGDNLELAIQYYQNALQIRTKSQFPQQWANTQHGLGIAYSNRIKGDKAENLEKAINCYQNALTIRTPEAFTLDHLQTSRNLGNLYFTQGNWQSAMETYCSGIEAIEILRNSGRNDQRRQEILSESMDIYEKMIQACVNVGNIPLAIETSERSRGRYLAELMASKDLYPNAEIPSEVLNYLEQLEELEDRLAELRNSQASDNTRSLESVGARRDSQDLITVITEEFNQLKAKKEELRLKIREFDPFLAGQKSVEAIPFDRIQALIDNDQTAILTFHSTSEATYAFIIYKDCPPKVHHYPNQGKSQLHRECLWDNWLTPYLTDFKGWNSNISTVLQQLSQCLEIDQLIDNYLQNIEELIIIPHFLLHQIPFAALPIKEVGSRKSEVGSVKEVRRMKSESESFGEVRGMGGSFKTTKTETIENVTYLSDKFRLRILPSCQILNYCHSRQPLENKTEMGLIENASEDLPYTTYECQQLAQKYNIKSNYRLTGQKATVQECRQLLDKVQIIHFSHHGSANPNNPLESSLILSDRNLTLGEILNWRLPNLSDVFLNNCETNFSVNKITDDLLTLSSGWLCIGARGVISTLWAVDDCASALFSLFYYEYRDAGLTRSQSLQQAQQTLRNLTGEKLKRDYSGQLEQHLHNLYQGTFRILETARFKDSETYQTYQKRLEKIDYQIKYTLPHHYRAKYPFKSPYYWAGFIAQGLA